ncbi:putative nap family protein [Phaeoacremonium minimum UCRPA7]|uniref:Putative nap family protein n=1 Tax=Phaeoacremonium minimum (strain UCR-PA7) TaxID=1286976 RepID=R8BE35_PHAM7|nr:putative nap family protein [Phaeoacremonium minimum UCRPA7]EON97568.1 putative nap family protein [Phaeoacremonium minimum UCRPA7]
MTAPLEDTPVTYEDLNDLNAEFDEVDTELLRQEVQLKNALYEKRQKVVSQIPNFWPLVLEQAPPDIDEYIQPSDSALLLSSLTALSVSHFEVENGGKGDPRSLSIKFEFNENEYFEDRVLEKKFWYRRSSDGWTGLVSEPVDIKWKKGKDLTSGLLGMVKKVWEAEQSKAKEGNGASKKAKILTGDQKALKKNMENTGLGGLSFFTWFGYIGKYITAEESKLANEKARKLREARQAGKAEENGEEEDDDDEDDDDDELELFPEGENLAVAIAEDLWPGAIKYFIQAQEQDGISDVDFESDEEEMEEFDDDEEPPSKKRKA